MVNEGIEKGKKHKDCANFVDGWCTLKRQPVLGEGPACPEFEPK